MPITMIVSAMSMTITVTACSVCTGKPSGHLLGSLPEAKELANIVAANLRELVSAGNTCCRSVSRKLCFAVHQKKKGIEIMKLWLRGKGGHSECADLSSSLEKISFWWIGFCARDCFKHSEANRRLLPRLFSEALEAGNAPELQCTKQER
jgi:hypothetical protein